eukprot:2618624-Rhodomonas_salina.1
MKLCSTNCQLMVPWYPGPEMMVFGFSSCGSAFSQCFGQLARASPRYMTVTPFSTIIGCFRGILGGIVKGWEGELENLPALFVRSAKLGRNFAWHVTPCENDLRGGKRAQGENLFHKVPAACPNPIRSCRSAALLSEVRGIPTSLSASEVRGIQSALGIPMPSITGSVEQDRECVPGFPQKNGSF